MAIVSVAWSLICTVTTAICSAGGERTATAKFAFRKQSCWNFLRIKKPFYAKVSHFNASTPSIWKEVQKPKQKQFEWNVDAHRLLFWISEAEEMRRCPWCPVKWVHTIITSDLDSRTWTRRISHERLMFRASAWSINISFCAVPCWWSELVTVSSKVVDSIKGTVQLIIDPPASVWTYLLFLMWTEIFDRQKNVSKSLLFWI